MHLHVVPIIDPKRIFGTLLALRTLDSCLSNTAFKPNELISRYLALSESLCPILSDAFDQIPLRFI